MIGECRNADCLDRRVHSKRTVGKNVTVKASNFNKSQQLSTNGVQQVNINHLRTSYFNRFQ
jgi:hypothetical protein